MWSDRGRWGQQDLLVGQTGGVAEGGSVLPEELCPGRGSGWVGKEIIGKNQEFGFRFVTFGISLRYLLNIFRVEFTQKNFRVFTLYRWSLKPWERMRSRAISEGGKKRGLRTVL